MGDGEPHSIRKDLTAQGTLKSAGLVAHQVRQQCEDRKDPGFELGTAGSAKISAQSGSIS